MDTTAKKKPKTMAELLMAEPGLGGLLSEDALISITHTAAKKPGPAVANSRTNEKAMKPLTIAEMFTNFRPLQSKSPRNKMQATASARKKWNSSSKLENKTVSHTSNGQMKHNSVRKVLNFQQHKPAPKMPKSFASSRMAMINSETPKFPKPEIKAKKSLYLQARNTVRISGICNIPETPIVINKPIKNRMTIANKENITTQPNVSKKLITTPKSTQRQRVLASRMADIVFTRSIPDTPLSNESWKSSCDASFLQNEQDIEYIESKTKALTDEHTLDDIAEISPPISTPFADYRNVKDFFSNSNDVTQNTYHDNTIMCFDSTISNENGKREESVILSLCNMFNKATVSTENHSTELDDIIEVQKRTENNIKMIENGIQTLNNIKESQLSTLHYVNKLIREKSQQTCKSNKANAVEATKESPTAEQNQSLSKPSSVIKTILKSPSYKVPKKYNTCMRKKVTYKSMPNISVAVTPQKDMGVRALSMYMKMKERNIYLNTPIAKQKTTEIPDTPAITSHNLQQQLDKLYGEC